jgi:hypothetical protein
LLRGRLEGDEARVICIAGLAVVLARAAGGHACVVHRLAVLVQVVDDCPTGVVALTVAVVLARGELAGLQVLEQGPPNHGATVGHARGDAAGILIALIAPEHAQRVDDVAAPDAVSPFKLGHRGLLRVALGGSTVRVGRRWCADYVDVHGQVLVRFHFTACL